MMNVPPTDQSQLSRPRSDNGIGIAGFVCSLVGLMSCGVLSPIGLILSIVGLRREPKQLAVAGVILGLIGSIWVIVALIFGLFAAILAALGIAAGQASGGPQPQ